MTSDELDLLKAQTNATEAVLRDQILSLKQQLATADTRLDAERTHTRYLLLAVGELKAAEEWAYRLFLDNRADDISDAVVKEWGQYRDNFYDRIDGHLTPLGPPTT